MDRFHRLLLDQIKRHGVYAWSDVARRRAFLHAVNDAYHRHDAEEAELKRSLDANSTELLNTSVGLQAIMRALPDQFFRLDAEGVILDYWPGTGTHLAIDVADPTARCLYDFVSDETAWRFRDAIAGVFASGELRCLEFSEGEDRHLEVRLFPVMQDHVVALVRDVSDRKYSEQRISHLAYHDILTGLPNRLLFKDRLELSIAFARRHGDMVAVMFLDLDRFKQINDTLGHGIGDQLLVTVARRLRESLRVTGAVTRIDENRAEMPVTIARMGGDEFTIILSEVADVQEVVKVARQVLDVISRPLELGGGEVYVTASIGIAVFPEDGADFETLVKNADAAMYHAKECGRNNYQIFTESMNAAAFERLMLESHLHGAVQRGEFEVHYQPLLDVASGRVASLEALLRWRHPQMGMIGPNLFIPLAEESDLILEVGDWLAREVCRQIRSWRDAGLVPHRVFLNISGQQMRPDHLLPTLMDALAESRLDSRHLGIELTETSIVAFPHATSSLLRHARTLGMKVAIDDFGTGYSGLSYLQSFPVDLLKIDKSFVGTISPDGGDGRLAAAIIALGHNLGLEVVAEGVETECQLDFLRENGCDKVQGYLICRPAPAGRVETFLQERPILAPLAAPLGG